MQNKKIMQKVITLVSKLLENEISHIIIFVRKSYGLLVFKNSGYFFIRENTQNNWVMSSTTKMKVS